jgi:hypothetical protein
VRCAVGVHAPVVAKPQAELRTRLLGRRLIMTLFVVAGAAMTGNPPPYPLIHAFDHIAKLGLRGCWVSSRKAAVSSSSLQYGDGRDAIRPLD